MNRLKNVFIFILVLLIIAALVYIVGIIFFPGFISQRISQAPPVPPVISHISDLDIQPQEEYQRPSLHIKTYKAGTFGPEEERLGYVSGSMKIDIPRLDYSGEILSVDLDSKTLDYQEQGLNENEITQQLLIDMDKELDHGVVLFNQAQLPGPENRNVSIAAHRDFKGMEFYYIDTLTEGDLIYLEYEGKTYIYEYDRTFITHESDWSPIAVSDKSQITLQSCDPIFPTNGEYERIFVVAYLIDIIDPDLDLATYGPFLKKE